MPSPFTALTWHLPADFAHIEIVILLCERETLTSYFTEAQDNTFTSLEVRRSFIRSSRGTGLVVPWDKNIEVIQLQKVCGILLKWYLLTK